MYPNTRIDLARRYFDPTSVFRKQSDEAFLASIAKSRVSGTLPEIGHVGGYEIVLLESLYANLTASYSEGITNSGIVLPLPEERQAELQQFVDRRANRTAEVITEVARQLRFENSAQDIDVRLENPLILGSMVLASTVHYGIKRRSGRDYYEHPREMSLMFEDAWLLQGKATNDEQYENIIAEILDHDTSEQTLDPKQYGFKTARGQHLFMGRHLFLPKTIEKMALQANATPERAAHLALINLALTRTVDIKGNKAKYQAVYIEGGLAMGGEDFGVAKWTDIGHNTRLEPDPRGKAYGLKSRRKQRQYRGGRKTISSTLPHLESLFQQIDATDQHRIDARKDTWAPFDANYAAGLVLAELSMA